MADLVVSKLLCFSIDVTQWPRMSLVFDDRNVVSFHLPISLFEIFRSLTSSILILEIIFNVQFSRYHLTDDLSVIQDQKFSELGSLVNTSVYKHLYR